MDKRDLIPNISEHITYKEATASNKAKQLGISNTPNEKELRAMKLLAEKVFEPLRKWYGKPIQVTSFFRSAKINKAVGGVQKGNSVSQHCFDEQTELLTVEGWKKYSELKVGEEIFSYNIEKGGVEIAPIDNIIVYDYSGDMICIKNKLLNLCVTDEHRLLVRSTAKKYVRKTNRIFSLSGQNYFDSLKSDNDKFHIEMAKDMYGKRRQMLKASNLIDYIQPPFSIGEMKLMVAIAADGYLHIRDGRYAGCGFRFKKQRKIDYVKEILTELSIPYTTRDAGDGITEFWVNKTHTSFIYEQMGEKKTLPSFFIKISPKIQKELILTYNFFDGCKDKREGCSSINISTTHEKNLNTLQAMCVLSGMRASISITPARIYNIKGKTGLAKQAYSMTICENKPEVKVSENNYSIKHYDGVVWCANNKNTTLIIRRGYNVSIQGNCLGQAVDIDTVSDNKKLFDYIKDNLPFDQLIWEYGNDSAPDWVHVSYSEIRNRKQVLRATKSGGKTVYLPYK